MVAILEKSRTEDLVSNLEELLPLIVDADLPRYLKQKVVNKKPDNSFLYYPEGDVVISDTLNPEDPNEHIVSLHPTERVTATAGEFNGNHIRIVFDKSSGEFTNVGVFTHVGGLILGLNSLKHVISNGRDPNAYRKILLLGPLPKTTS